MNRPTTNTAAVAERAPKPATEAECRAALAEAYPNGDPKFYNPNEPTPRAPTTVSDADLRACCEGLKSTASYEDYRQLGCCAQAFESGHCTPWGPPTPPAMRAVA
jgi:hypothetical protein